MEHIIWTNNLDYEDWKDQLEADWPDEEGYDEEHRIRIMYEMNDDDLEEEKHNLNKELGHRLVMFGELDLWNGKIGGRKILSGTNLNDIFTGTCGDYITWYLENGDVKCKDSHHDGTNLYIYRVLKKDDNEFDIEDFLEASIADAYEMTEPLGHYVEEIYGLEE